MGIKTVSVLGTGWLGQPLAEFFVSRGFRVKASTTTESRLSDLSLLHFEPFLLNIDQLPGNVQEFLRADILVINIPSKKREAFIRLAEEIEKSDIKRIVFVSSTSVYANNNTIITESADGEGLGGPLFEIENLLRKSRENGKARKIQTTIVRFGGLVGYSRNPGNFFVSGRSVRNPDSPVNLIHRDDCIGIIGKIVENEVWGEVFNCCADTHPTKRQFYTQAAVSIGNPVPEFVDSGVKSFKIISNNKVKRILGYEFLHPDLMKINF